MSLSFGTLENTVCPIGKVRRSHSHHRERPESGRYTELDGDRRLCRLVECGPRGPLRRQARPPRWHPRKHGLFDWEGPLFPFPSSRTPGVPSLYRVRRRPPIMSIGGVWAARAFVPAGSAFEAAPSKTQIVPLGRSSVFIPIVARPGGQGTRLKPCPDTRCRTSEFRLSTPGGPSPGRLLAPAPDSQRQNMPRLRRARRRRSKHVTLFAVICNNVLH
jgi:hypothetical protein